ncbi:MAG: hypothetical protein ACI9QL_001128 [Candidatus Omnitrophota bacterium]
MKLKLQQLIELQAPGRSDQVFHALLNELSDKPPRSPQAPEGPEWNAYRLTVRNGRVIVEVNGTVVNRVYGCTKKPGRIVLRNEGSPSRFRNLIVRHLD